MSTVGVSKGTRMPIRRILRMTCMRLLRLRQPLLCAGLMGYGMRYHVSPPLHRLNSGNGGFGLTARGSMRSPSLGFASNPYIHSTSNAGQDPHPHIPPAISTPSSPCPSGHRHRHAARLRQAGGVCDEPGLPPAPGLPHLDDGCLHHRKPSRRTPG